MGTFVVNMDKRETVSFFISNPQILFSKVTFFLQEILNQALAKAILVSGSPLSLVEHPLWIAFFKKIRPAFSVPTRSRISTTYLNAEYTALQTEIKEELASCKNLHLQCDGWSNLRNESIIDFVVTTPEPRFVDFIITEENRHDAEYLSQQMKKIMEKYGPEIFFCYYWRQCS